MEHPDASPCAASLDLTSAFHQCVRRERTRLGLTRRRDDLMKPRPPAPSAWASASRAIVNDLVEMRAVLQQHGRGYLGMHRFGAVATPSTVPLSEQERDDLDRHCFEVLQSSSRHIERLKQGIASATDSLERDVRMHREAIIASLYERVQGIAATLKTMRKLRLRQATAAINRLSQGGAAPRREPEEVSDAGGSNTHPVPAGLGLEWLSNGMQELAELDQDEEMMFEAENQALAEELDSHADAARQLERKMEEISQMVTFFATKVEEQDGEIDAIFDNVHDAQDHLRSGNAQLAQASQQSFLGRFSLLLFLILASAALLFLDWYG